MSKKQKESLVPLISTLIVAVLAIGMAIAAIVILNGSDDNDVNSGTGTTTASQPTFQPSEAFNEECEIAIPKLVEGNSRIISLFMTNGLPHEDEPYGNLPEDGLYTVNSSEFATLADIEDFVKSIYTDSEAERILTNIDGSGMAVYQVRKITVKVEETYEGTAESTAESTIQYEDKYVLGINADFVPDTAYSRDWTDLNYSYEPVTETECDITLYFNGYTPTEDTQPAEGDVLNLKMVKIGTEWRLTALGY